MLEWIITYMLIVLIVFLFIYNTNFNILQQ